MTPDETDTPDPRLVALGVHRVEQHFIRRYKKRMRQYRRTGNGIVKQTGIAAVWQAIGEQEKAAAAQQKAQRLRDKRAQLEIEISRLVRALAHLQIDAQSLLFRSPPPPPPPSSPQDPAKPSWEPWQTSDRR